MESVATPGESVSPEVLAERKRARGRAMVEKRRQKVAAVFAGKKFKVVREVHLENKGERFRTPFGTKCRNGFVLENQGDGSQIVVGASVLKRAAEEFNAVDLPTKSGRRPRRTKAQMAAARGESGPKAQEDAVRPKTDTEMASSFDVQLVGGPVVVWDEEPKAVLDDGALSEGEDEAAEEAFKYGF